ncbi:MAG TPA: hypothetical protein VEM95_07535 [Thermoplasmata archaeon]|nr:hypothetical protein [Thermoplasmata archaeon]
MEPRVRREEVDRLMRARNRLVRRVQLIEDQLRELGVDESSLITPPPNKPSARAAPSR